MERQYIDRYCTAKVHCNPWQLNATIQLQVEWNSFFFFKYLVHKWMIIKLCLCGWRHLCFCMQLLDDSAPICSSSMLNYHYIGMYGLAAPEAAVSNDHLHIVLFECVFGKICVLL